jgi:outer membrane protein OmpA-like peptidoglycan-associated protein
MALNLKKGNALNLRKENDASPGISQGIAGSKKKKPFWPFLLLAILVIGGLLGFLMVNKGKTANVANGPMVAPTEQSSVPTTSTQPSSNQNEAVSNVADKPASSVNPAVSSPESHPEKPELNSDRSTNSTVSSSTSNKPSSSVASSNKSVSSGLKENNSSPAVPVQVENDNFDGKVLFKFDSSILSESGENELGNIAKKITGYSKIIIKGHSCNLGPEEAKQAISSLRAESVQKYLISIGVSAKMEAVGVSDREPLALNSSAADRSKNRCVTIKGE